jgi:iron complex outermembrane receptor protein
MGHQIFDLSVNQLDVSKDFEIGWASPLHLSLGLMHRYERFENQAGEPDSYRDGMYVIPAGSDPWHTKFAGQSPSPGLVSFTGTSTADARALHRNNYAAYAELSAKPFKPWEVVLAGRGERYDDSAGNVGSGKISTRYEFLKGFALRGGANTGFRAPSLAQQGFSTTQNTATTIMNQRVSTTSKLLNVDSPAAIALGAKPLKPEKSVSVTAGFTMEPVKDLHFTADFYQTSIRDRILTTGFLGTANNGGETAAMAIADIFATAGVRGITSAQFFMNAVNTTTRGVDVVLDYTLRSARFGTFKPAAAFNFAATEIDKVARNPAQLAALGVTLFGRQPRIDLQRAVPRTKLILNGNWQIWRFRNDLRVTRWGKYTEASTTPGSDAYFGAKWIVDLDISYGITDHVSLALGAYNLFNVYPDKKGPIGTTDGTGQYGQFSPIGFTGGFYYARLGVEL